MDDQQTYLLNGLLTRQFGLGRVVRFREMGGRGGRGRQAAAFEVFTAEEKEYLVYLYPAVFEVDQLERAARAVNALDGERFSVVPFLGMKGQQHAGGNEEEGEEKGAAMASDRGGFIGEGPQGTRMMVSLAPAGSVLDAGLYSAHDISQVGLRLAWMHRLLKEQLPMGAEVRQESLAERLRVAAGDVGHATFTAAAIGTLLPMLGLPAAQGWAHGDIGPAAFLVDGDHQIRTVTDWGLLHVGSPLEDVVDAFLCFCADPEGQLLEARGAALLEAYDTLLPIRKVPWTPVVASWCAQRLLDNQARRRALPVGFGTVLQNPERLTIALASCI